jgi:predicted RNA-binding Zn-ribbon protein involved in translation (DUF1610 family)
MPGGRGMGGGGSGRGGGRGRSGGRGSTGGGQGRNRGGAFGAGGYCVCASCGAKVPHERGVKCTELKCPQCNRTMIREELLNQAKNPGDQS